MSPNITESYSYNFLSHDKVQFVLSLLPLHTGYVIRQTQTSLECTCVNSGYVRAAYAATAKHVNSTFGHAGIIVL